MIFRMTSTSSTISTRPTICSTDMVSLLEGSRVWPAAAPRCGPRRDLLVVLALVVAVPAIVTLVVAVIVTGAVAVLVVRGRVRCEADAGPR